MKRVARRSIVTVRRRRSLDELLPLTLFSSLGTNGLNSSAQMGRGRQGVRGSTAPVAGGSCNPPHMIAGWRPTDIHGQNSTHVQLLAPDFWTPAAYCAKPGGLEGSVESGGCDFTPCDPETVALSPGHMLGNTNHACSSRQKSRSG